MTTKPKRFIAGAICPRCGELDKLVMFRKGERAFRECVSCGFADEIMAQSPTRLATRVDDSSPSIEATIAPVKFVDPTPRSGQ